MVSNATPRATCPAVNWPQLHQQSPPAQRCVKDIQSFYSFFNNYAGVHFAHRKILQDISMLVLLISILFILAVLTDGEVTPLASCGPRK